jgi:hypothetical protein
MYCIAMLNMMVTFLSKKWYVNHCQLQHWNDCWVTHQPSSIHDKLKMCEQVWEAFWYSYKILESQWSRAWMEIVRFPRPTPASGFETLKQHINEHIYTVWSYHCDTCTYIPYNTIRYNTIQYNTLHIIKKERKILSLYYHILTTITNTTHTIH